MRLSGGRLRFALLLPTALLATRGARTDALRRNSVIYFHDGDRVVIVASKLGLPQHPAWFHNLRSNPLVRLGGRPFRAEVITDDAERARLWDLADRVFPPYATYRVRAAPLVGLSRSSASTRVAIKHATLPRCATRGRRSARRCRVAERCTASGVVRQRRFRWVVGKENLAGAAVDSCFV